MAVGLGAFFAGRHASAVKGTGRVPTPSTAARALAVASATPSPGATGVPPDQVVTLRFSSRIAGVSGLPAFDPPVKGTWTQVGPDTVTFAAAAPFVPTSTETLVVPAGTSGPAGAGGTRLAAPVTLSFTVAQASTERLQQLLAELNYLPLSFTPSAGLASPIEAATAQAGTFAWRWPGTPVSLTSLWTEGAEDVITKAAVMNFENQHGLAADGLAGRRVWSALLADFASGRVNADPYTYVFVSKQLPEALTLFENGAPVMVNVPVNTGAPGADTVDGTYPVFEHVTSSRDEGDQPRRQHLRRPERALGQLLRGGRRAARVRPGDVRIPPEQRVRRDAHPGGGAALAAHPDRHPGHRGRTGQLNTGAAGSSAAVRSRTRAADSR